jgi:hypothetical protein
MKIAGKKIEGRNTEIIVLPRPLGEDIVLRAEAVLSLDNFHKLCNEPKPPMQIRPGGIQVANVTDPGYKEQLNLYQARRLAYLILESLKATPDLEWETVKEDDPGTWTNWETELLDSGLSAIEIGRIRTGVFTANCLNEALIQEARETFLRGIQASLSP